MKHLYIKDINTNEVNEKLIELLCFVKSIRFHKNNFFLDLVDSTGQTQGVIKDKKLFDYSKRITKESCILIKGLLINVSEIEIVFIEIINLSKNKLTPSPRSNFNIFDKKYTNLILSKKHLYLRNQKLIAIQVFKNHLLHLLRNWFFDNNYIEITAPIITPLTLYDNNSALKISVHGQELFLTQCAGQYLEAACVAHEKVYNIGPSFRGEEGRSKRHLIEYWHIKAEVAFANHNDIIFIVESILKYITENLFNNQHIINLLKENNLELIKDALFVPFKRITYREAIKILRNNNFKISFGTSISSQHEKFLSEYFESAFWLMYTPKEIEPFSYKLHTEDKSLTLVADLIASDGFGEILGTAEKIFNPKELKERMIEKGKYSDSRYKWVKEIHNYGSPPHSAFGIGLERLVRWLIKIEHVRDIHPFPRAFGRKINI